MRLPVLVAVALVIGAMIIPSALVHAQSAGPCGLANAAFCDTFDAPAGISNRSGQLNGTVWGASRNGGNENFGEADNWVSSQQSVCGTSQSFAPDNDIFICNGHVVEGYNDGGTVDTLAMYPKQPFDFAGRTGKVVFDVSNDTDGNHSAWPEFWITDKPIPAPFTHEASFISQPQNGLGIRFAGFVNSSGSATTCPEGESYFGVDSAVTVSNYVVNDTFNGGHVNLQGLDCVKKASGPGQMNHVEIDVSQNQIDVYATDAGTTAPLKHIATIPNAGLSFTRGLIWIEDAHYNGDKFNNEGTHEFAWDNVGFDGPLLPRDLAYDVNDNACSGTCNLGWTINQGASKTFTLSNMVAPSQAVGALLTFNFWEEAAAPFNFNYAINGHAYSYPWPYADKLTFSPRTIGIPLNLSDLQPGTNAITFTPAVTMNVFNIDIIMQGAGGIAPPGGGTSPTSTPVPPTATSVPPTATSVPPTATSVPPTATSVPPTATTIPATPVPTDTPIPPTATPVITDTPIPATPTPSPIVTCQAVVMINGQQQLIDKPISFCQPSS